MTRSREQTYKYISSLSHQERLCLPQFGCTVCYSSSITASQCYRTLSHALSEYTGARGSCRGSACASFITAGRPKFETSFLIFDGRLGRLGTITDRESETLRLENMPSISRTQTEESAGCTGLQRYYAVPSLEGTSAFEVAEATYVLPRLVPC